MAEVRESPILDEMDLWNLFCDAIVELEIHGVHYSLPSTREIEAIGVLMDTLTDAWETFIGAGVKS